MTTIPELVNLANGLAQHGDKLAVKICRDAIKEIKRLREELAGFEAGAQAEADAGDEARAEVKQLREIISKYKGGQ